MEYNFDDRGIAPKVKEALDEVVALIPEDGGDGGTAAANVPQVSAADAGTIGASYTQTEVQAIATLANANKAAINAVISALITAGLMEGA